ncbi:MAG TPA: DUF3224 domain-containing protein [Pyrinomonadaceae bacterium]|nr:DUF3224 domain-containing protein [Pyrinomonadaceae bacterium]
MSTQANATFDITGWEVAEETATESAEEAKLSRATIKKAFHGDLEGTSVATGLFCQSADGTAGGYMAQERVEGSLSGKSGSFVIQHGGIKTATGQNSFGNIIPGTGTGELKGLRGEALIAHDEQGARLTLDYDFD